MQVSRADVQPVSVQGSIQTVTSPDWPGEGDLVRCAPSEQFLWLPRDQLCVLVYLITVMHSMQGGYMEKAERYTEKAIQNIMKLQVKKKTQKYCKKILTPVYTKINADIDSTSIGP